jgi:hypothetical protein
MLSQESVYKIADPASGRCPGAAGAFPYLSGFGQALSVSGHFPRLPPRTRSRYHMCYNCMHSWPVCCFSFSQPASTERIMLPNQFSGTKTVAVWAGGLFNGVPWPSIPIAPRSNAVISSRSHRGGLPSIGHFFNSFTPKMKYFSIPETAETEGFPFPAARQKITTLLAGKMISAGQSHLERNG